MPEDSASHHAHSFWGRLSITFVTTSCALFLFFFLYKLIRNKWFTFCESVRLFGIRYRRNLPYENRLDNPSFNFRSRDLAVDIVASTQVVQYKVEIKNGDFDNRSSECVICLQEFREGEWLRVLPHCSHGFHVPCIDTWLESHSDCPLCRKQVMRDFGDYRATRVAMPVSFESLPREDFQRPRDYHLLDSASMRNDARGIQSLMWL